jgi:DNA-binding PadR family transcriptional regulator
MGQVAGTSTSTSKWMRGGGADALRGALLGLVLQSPGRGSELIGRLIRRVGETWRIEPKYVYRLLDALEEEGLLCSVEEPRRGTERRTRVVYHPTEQTEVALACWMKTLVPRERVRLGLQAKFAVARPEHVPGLLVALREYERECMGMAQLVFPAVGDPPSWPALFLNITRASVHKILEAEIDWAACARQQIEEYAARNP